MEKLNTQITEEFPDDYTVVDIETTGLSPVKNDIIEISALKIRNNKISDEFSQLIKPSDPIGRFITSLTGITNEMVEFAPSVKDVLPAFIDFISNDIILGHNIRFDLNFIRTNLANSGYKQIENQTLDTMMIARRRCKLKSHSLKNLALHYNLSTEGHHRALNDCLITHNVYQNIKKQAMEEKAEA